MNYMLYFLISIICINYSLGNIQEIKNIPEVQVKYSDLKFYQNTSEITIDITDSEKSRKMFSLGKEIILFKIIKAKIKLQTIPTKIIAPVQQRGFE